MVIFNTIWLRKLWLQQQAGNAGPNCSACGMTILAAKPAGHKSEQPCLHLRASPTYWSSSARMGRIARKGTW